jgi:hypothetical protein
MKRLRLAALAVAGVAAVSLASCARSRGGAEAGRGAAPIATVAIPSVPSTPSPSEEAPDAAIAFHRDDDAGDAAAASCERRASFTAKLGDDTVPTHVEWLRCGPREAMWTDAGEIAYPSDRLTLTRAGEPPLLLYSNDDDRGLDELDYVEELHVGTGPGAQLFYSVHSYGTGNIHDWKVMDRSKGKLRTWLVETPSHRASLRADEHLGKQVGAGVERRGATFIETFAVYETHDPNCCPTRGELRVEYEATGGVLKRRRVWRQPRTP